MPSKSNAGGGQTRVHPTGPAQSGGRVRWYTAGLSSSAICTAFAISTPNTTGPNRDAISNAVVRNPISALMTSSIREMRPPRVTRQAKNAETSAPSTWVPSPGGPLPALRKTLGSTASEIRKLAAMSKPARRGSRHSMSGGTSFAADEAAPGLPAALIIRVRHGISQVPTMTPYADVLNAPQGRLQPYAHNRRLGQHVTFGLSRCSTSRVAWVPPLRGG